MQLKTRWSEVYQSENYGKSLTRPAGYVIHFDLLRQDWVKFNIATQERSRVKKLTLLLCCLLMTTPVWAQDDPGETVTPPASGNGGFGGPVLKVTEIDDKFGLLIGGRGGWVFNHVFVVGGGLYSLLRDVEIEDSGFERDLEFAYGGLELELIIVPRQRLHLSIQTLLGFGGLTDRTQRFDRFGQFDSRFNGPDDSFLISEQGLNLVWNMKTYMRIGLGGSYRFIRGVELAGLSNSDLRGPSAVLSVKFGRF